MGYSDLYGRCQAFDIPVHRKLIVNEVVEITKYPRPRHYRVGIETIAGRGMFISAKNTEHPFVKQVGTHVIITARELNKCWERFVFIKELMHYFDDQDQETDSGEALEEVLTDLSGPGTPNGSSKTEAEILCFWMALGCLCPEPARAQFKSDLEGGRIDHYSIALQLRMPEQYVPRLFDPAYDRITKRLLGD